MIYVDFEYRSMWDTESIICVGVMPSDEQPVVFDLRDIKERKQFIKYVNANKHEVWAAYNASAEINCMLTLGINTLDLKWIDVMAEATMIMRTKSEYYSQQSSLTATLSAFSIPTRTSERDKDLVRGIILNNTEYTEIQWELITEYNITDIEILPDLLTKFADIHNQSSTYESKSKYLQSAIYRGMYINSAAYLYHNSKGFPLNENLLNSIFENKFRIIGKLCQEINDEIAVLYIWDKKQQRYKFTPDNRRLLKLLHTDPSIKIISTPTGMVSIEHLDDMIKDHPKFGKVYRVHQTIQALSGSDPRSQVLPGGYIRAGYRTFIQDTGRSSPKPKEGMLLNTPAWFRRVIHPHKGEVVIGVDWSQQEIYIGAVLSQDRKLMEAYLSGDIYLHLAKQAGAVPPDATKSSHPTQRQNFKAVQLGLGYGKGLESLAIDVYNNNIINGEPQLSRFQAHKTAERIIEWHKRTFNVYWSWIDKHIKTSRFSGKYMTVDDSWVRFCPRRTAATKLKNLPMQSNGAAVLRRAMILLSSTDLDVIASHHDAVYIRSTTENAESDKAKLVETMNRACSEVFGELSTFYNGEEILINTDSKIYTHETGYTDSRGDVMFATISKLLESDLADIVPRDYEHDKVLKPRVKKPPKPKSKRQLKKELIHEVIGE